MKEFIKKLIKRLEEYKYSHLLEHNSEECLHCQENEDDWNCFNRNCLVCVCDRTISIVNQLVEEYKPKTQADKIRAMSDEKLAGLTITYNDYYGEYYCSDEERYDSYEDAIKHEIEWLQSEAE